MRISLHGLRELGEGCFGFGMRGSRSLSRGLVGFYLGVLF